MKKPSVRSLLLGLVLALFLVQTWATPTAKADYIGNCGDAYEVVAQDCTLWGWWCTPVRQGCVDCDGGTFCYPLY